MYIIDSLVIFSGNRQFKPVNEGTVYSVLLFLTEKTIISLDRSLVQVEFPVYNTCCICNFEVYILCQCKSRNNASHIKELDFVV